MSYRYTGKHGLKILIDFCCLLYSYHAVGDDGTG